MHGDASIAGLPEVGTVLAGRFRVGEIVGRGGMGVVTAGRHLQLQAPVAIKFLLPDHARKPGPLARFLREARSAARLRGEHATRIFDVGSTEDGVPFFVMEFLEGRSLDAVLDDDGPLPVPMAVDYVLQACEALAEAHAAGIVHRDLKPANLFVTTGPDGTSFVKVLDFGISKAAAAAEDELSPSPSLTGDGEPLGSPQYMAPEQLRSPKGVDQRCDVWGLGVLLFELLTGRTPFAAESVPHLYAMILSSPPLALRELRPEVPRALAAVVERCLEKARDDRPAHVAELATLLAPYGPEGSTARAERIVRMRRATPVDEAPSSRRLPSSLELAATQPAPRAMPSAARATLWATACMSIFLVGAIGYRIARGAPEPAVGATRMPSGSAAPMAAAPAPEAAPSSVPAPLSSITSSVPQAQAPESPPPSGLTSPPPATSPRGGTTPAARELRAAPKKPQDTGDLQGIRLLE